MAQLRGLRTEDASQLPGTWNECFADTPNFVKVGESDLRRRVFAQPGFDPKGVIVGADGARVKGFVHFGPRSNLWHHVADRRLDPEEGHIYTLAAPPSELALARDLLAGAETRLRASGARRALLGTSWVYGTQPYYNGIAGAYEIPGLSTTWQHMIAMAEESGYALAAEYGTPEIDLSGGVLPAALEAAAEQLEERARAWGLRLGSRPVESPFFPRRKSVELSCGRGTVATTAYGLWPEHLRQYNRRLYGLTSVYVARRWRGKGLGKLIVIEAVRAALREGAEGVHLHVWRENETAWGLYHRALGFQPTYTWVTLEKMLA